VRRRFGKRIASVVLHDDVPVQERQHCVRIDTESQSRLCYYSRVQVGLVPAAASARVGESSEIQWYFDNDDSRFLVSS
jgi:hypothetical protein